MTWTSIIYREAREQDTNAHLHHHTITTATGTLHTHLDKFHREEYNKHCAENALQNHLKEANIQKAAKVEAVIQVAKGELFNVDGLLMHIVRWIVADDQVSFLFQ
jgi:hypothetical protein